ncbi:MAG: hypothetical protein HFF26_00350 [Oscillospiraceae bacterium]|nr:hypothetical protein [Oscillospiraceae bacterium]
MPIGKPKEPKAPKKEKKQKPPKEKKPKKGKVGAPEAAEQGDQGEQPEKKKLPLIFLLIPAVVIVAAAVILFVFILPGRNADDPAEPTPTVEPSPPVLPSELPVGENVVPGMVLGSDEYLAQAVPAKTITYTYTDLVDAGKVAETYVGQLKGADPKFSMVDEEFVRVKESPDFTAPEGVVLMARNLPKPEPEPTASPEGEESADPEASSSPEAEQSPEVPESQAPVEEPESKVLTVRIQWSPGQCVVTADEELGKVTSPKPQQTSHGSISMSGAQTRLEGMSPAQLELPGESMDAYEVMAMDGTEMVNGAACIRLNVYNGKNAENSYQFMGGYLMSIDGQHLYRLDPVTNEIHELDYQP